jgi:hypothetical protein
MFDANSKCDVCFQVTNILEQTVNEHNSFPISFSIKREPEKICSQVTDLLEDQHCNNCGYCAPGSYCSTAGAGNCNPNYEHSSDAI